MKEYQERLQDYSTVLILGNQSIVSDDVEKVLDGIEVKRIDGDSLYEECWLFAAEIWQNGTAEVVLSSSRPADIFRAYQVAKMDGMPMVVCEGSVTEASNAAIKEMTKRNVYALQGFDRGQDWRGVYKSTARCRRLDRRGDTREAAPYLLLFMAIMSITLLSAAEDAPLERGVKGEVEDVILVGADDWHASIAATPLAIWSEDNQTRIMPMLILPKVVQAGDRNGWVEESDLKRYGESAILDTFKAANISAITIHGTGDQVKALVESAHKDGLEGLYYGNSRDSLLFLSLLQER